MAGRSLEHKPDHFPRQITASSYIIHSANTVARHRTNALLFGVINPVTRYYLPEVTLQVTS